MGSVVFLTACTTDIVKSFDKQFSEYAGINCSATNLSIGEDYCQSPKQTFVQASVYCYKTMGGVDCYRKKKQRALRENFPENLGLRVHRTLSWLQRAEIEEDDHDAAFIFYWVAYNAAYAKDTNDTIRSGERFLFKEYFEVMNELDKGQEIYSAIWGKFSGPIRLLLENRFVFQPFWNCQNKIDGYEDWEVRFVKSKTRIHKALANKETTIILSILFDRLYVLRNQLMHGGATWNSGVNRSQVRDGASILGFLVPLFIDLMMDNPTEPWDASNYPVVYD